MNATQKPDYGIDAPTVIRNLFLAAGLCLVLAFAFPVFEHGHLTFARAPGLLWSAACFALSPALMLLYALVGKFSHRDRMLARAGLTGAESVLDVGTGRGLLLIGAAKRLTTGHATGIDIWNAEDLSGNGPEALKTNIALEGVADRTTILSEDARKMSFPDGSFDVVLSNLCLHNIYDQPGREQACREIARVLKPGGVTVIADFRHVSEYAKSLDKRGMKVQLFAPDFSRTFPPLRTLVGRK